MSRQVQVGFTPLKYIERNRQQAFDELPNDVFIELLTRLSEAECVSQQVLKDGPPDNGVAVFYGCLSRQKSVYIPNESLFKRRTELLIEVFLSDFDGSLAEPLHDGLDCMGAHLTEAFYKFAILRKRVFPSEMLHEPT